MGKRFGGRLDITKVCTKCGSEFHPWSLEQEFCSRQCWLKLHNNPERNRKVAQETAEYRGDLLRYSDGDRSSYKKRNGRHEHRIVMEQKLGRPLTPNDIVHHIDGDIHNNHPDNLELTTRADHAKHHWFGHEIKGGEAQ